ncbi:Lrp/AsnC family transcriptional regulator [uncultured Brevundimonas sp.]|jgi:DNA-binding Lrp family transcriptional regulator|uniref:Lrp/AsnC family transcriptional regulator n=1 Tax=uncultured Brevundimonas sp. TaxID=213418 RepID=UPI0025E71DD7|nr:Lrp/AsnC family transcriptional regulator [uncultured Brevundimonas sp.]
MPGLDDVDRRIVRQLRANARIPNAALAKSVGLSPSACLRRVKLLEDRGVIRGYQAVVAEGDEDSVVAIVLITLEKQTGDYMRRFETAVREHPEIQECYLMAGEADYVLRAAAPSIAAYEVIHKDVLSCLPGVSRIHSSLAIRNVLAGRGRR